MHGTCAKPFPLLFGLELELTLRLDSYCTATVTVWVGIRVEYCSNFLFCSLALEHANKLCHTASFIRVQKDYFFKFEFRKSLNFFKCAVLVC